jgi:predicted nucleotidyltransferase
MDAWIRGWKERIRAEEERRSAHTAALREGARAAAEALMEMGVRRVWLFGSVAGNSTHARSDIDLAIEGLEAKELFKAWDIAGHAVGSGVTVDLIRIEEASPRLRKQIEAGEVLLER